MLKPFLSLALVAISFLAFSQPTIEWKKAYGGTAGDGISGSTYLWADIKQTSDGGYIFIGNTASTDGDITGSKGAGDIWVVKTTPAGAIQWQKCYGGTKSEVGTSIMQTTDGGYIGAGYSYSSDGDLTANKGQNDIWVFKTDAMGAITWQKNLGGSQFDEFTQSVRQTSDGGYVVTGISYSTDGDLTGKPAGIDIWVVKLTSAGTIAWQKVIGGNSTEGSGSVEPTPDGGYIVAGSTGSTSGNLVAKYSGGDACLVKLNATGDIQWAKSYGGSKMDHFTMAIPGIGGGYIAVGTTLSKDNDITGAHDTTEIFVVKTDDTGKIEWAKTFGGSKVDEGFSVTVSNEGYYIVGASTLSNDGDVSGLHGSFTDHLLLGIYPNGTLRWSKVVGSEKHDRVTNVAKTADSGFVMMGNLAEGTADGAGCGHQGGFDFWVVKFSSTVGINDVDFNQNISLYPNPASDIVNIELPYINSNSKLTLTDINGTVLKSINLTSEKMTVDISEFATGIYLLHYSDGEHRHISKITKM